MAVETVSVACAHGAYTLIAENKTNCSVQLRTNGSVAPVIASSQPAAGAGNYITIVGDKAIDIGSMSGTEDVWFMPYGDAAMTVAVMRG